MNKLLKSKEYQKKFKEIFGFEAPIDFDFSAMAQYVAIDVIKLDEMLQVPDGISTKEFIAEKYGKEAADLVGQWILL